MVHIAASEIRISTTPIFGGGISGAEIGGSMAGPIGGLIGLNVGLLINDASGAYDLGAAHGWWGQPKPNQKTSHAIRIAPSCSLKSCGGWKKYKAGMPRNGDPKLDARIVAELAASRKSYDIETYEFSQISLASPSTWDAYIRRLTPEQPTALADNLASVLEYQRFEELWNSVKVRVTAAQKDQLVSWYHEMAKARERRDIVPAK